MLSSVSPHLITSPNNNNNNINHNTSLLRVGISDGGGAMVAAASGEAQESGGTSGGSCGDAAATQQGGGGVLLNEEGEKMGGGKRWPRQETMALLKIRSDMDLAFRDSSLKAPLWENISRKMAELGYHRNAKKCKEKFENVYKYHKRTKEGRSSKSDGKTYRFFDQLQALENIIGAAPPPPPPPRPSPPTVTMAVPIQVVQPIPTPAQVHPLTVSLSTPQNNTVNFNNPFASKFPQQPTTVVGNAVVPPSFMSNSPSSSSSTSSNEDIEKRHKRKRKYKDLFESLMKTVVEKQEDFQRKFLETLEKREKSRVMREEAWKAQEISRLKNEQDLLVEERSMAAARESTLISLLQKINQRQHTPIPPNNPNNSVVKSLPPTPTLTLTPPPAVINQSATTSPPPPLATPPVIAPQPIKVLENRQRQENSGIGGSEIHFNTSPSSALSSSRWPKAEIDALINLRTHLDNKYHENGPKGPLWEEISSEMKKIGYNRNAKRCKEKWENINKYFKKVKESNKSRPEDSKTCPYFHQLEALYKQKEKYSKPANPTVPIIMARPEQQWPLLSQEHQNQQQEAGAGAGVPFQLQHQQHHHAMQERDGENNDEDEYDEDEDDEGSAYEVVTNKQPSSVTSTV